MMGTHDPLACIYGGTCSYVWVIRVSADPCIRASGVHNELIYNNISGLKQCSAQNSLLTSCSRAADANLEHKAEFSPRMRRDRFTEQESTCAI